MIGELPADDVAVPGSICGAQFNSYILLRGMSYVPGYDMMWS